MGRGGGGELMKENRGARIAKYLRSGTLLGESYIHKIAGMHYLGPIKEIFWL